MRRLSRRRFVQLIAALALNPFIPGFFRGTIARAATKGICVPVLNCYSCPSAIFACPIGSLQHGLAAARSRLAIGEVQLGLYSLGVLGVAGAIAGRLPCGWLCPFGLIQDLIHKIPSPKLSIPRPFGYLRYAVLGVLVIGLPLLILDSTGFGQTWFCKWLCPAGTLEAGVPLVALNAGIRSQVGLLFGWKIAVLAGFLVLMVITSRPFCRTTCPLGAILGLLNRSSILRIRADTRSCTDCGECRSVCPVQLDVRSAPNSPDCIRCLRCARACPQSCLSFGRFIAGTDTSADGTPAGPATRRGGDRTPASDSLRRRQPCSPSGPVHLTSAPGSVRRAPRGRGNPAAFRVW